MTTENIHLANLGFFLNYEDGRTNDEIESEIFKILFQNKDEIHYDRDIGGNFKKLEQDQRNTEALIFMFMADIIESIYKLNQEKAFDPYIIIGSDNIFVDIDDSGKYEVTLEWKLLQDMTTFGELTA